MPGYHKFYFMNLHFHTSPLSYYVFLFFTNQLQFYKYYFCIKILHLPAQMRWAYIYREPDIYIYIFRDASKNTYLLMICEYPCETITSLEFFVVSAFCILYAPLTEIVSIGAPKLDSTTLSASRGMDCVSMLPLSSKTNASLIDTSSRYRLAFFKSLFTV